MSLPVYSVRGTRSRQHPVVLCLSSIGVAVWRSRLWEIDRIINQTLVYATLTVTLALVYAALIIGLPLLVHELTGQIANSPPILERISRCGYAILNHRGSGTPDSFHASRSKRDTHHDWDGLRRSFFHLFP